MRPARCRQRPPSIGFHSSASSAPMVSQADIGTGLGFFNSGLRELMATAKPRLGVTSDLMVSSREPGPPCPAADRRCCPVRWGWRAGSWAGRPCTRRPERTPETTLCVSPCGLPTAITACPVFERRRVAQLQGLAIPWRRCEGRRDRACGRRHGWLWPRDFLPSASSTVMGRASPMTWQLVAIRPSPNDEAGAEAVLSSIAPGHRDDHDRRAHCCGDLFDRLGEAFSPHTPEPAHRGAARTRCFAW